MKPLIDPLSLYRSPSLFIPTDRMGLYEYRKQPENTENNFIFSSQDFVYSSPIVYSLLCHYVQIYNNILYLS